MDWHGLNSCTSVQGQVEGRVNAVKDFRIPKNAGKLFTNRELLICPEVLCCTVLVG
jgi:hypothetical protein